MKIEAIQVRPQNNGVLFAESFMPYLQKEIGMTKESNILHLFSAKSKIGETCDIITFNNPDHILDCSNKLPFKDESYDYVIADPPYDWSVHKNTTASFKPYSFIPEAIRVLKPGGYLVVLHFLNYKTYPEMKKTHLVGVDIGPNFGARWLSIFRKVQTTIANKGGT